jgi:hypothetical protein
LIELKEDLVAVARRESFALSCLKGGIARGALTEVSGPAGGGKTEVVLRFLAENPKLRAAWIEEALSVYPCAFPLHGVNLNRVLFVRDPGTHAVWAAQQILRSGIFPVVVLAVKALAELDLRRLQLAAEQSNASVLLLSEEPARGAWAIGHQLEIRRQETSVQVGLLKGRELWSAHG